MQIELWACQNSLEGLERVCLGLVNSSLSALIDDGRRRSPAVRRVYAVSGAGCASRRMLACNLILTDMEVFAHRLVCSHSHHRPPAAAADLAPAASINLIARSSRTRDSGHWLMGLQLRVCASSNDQG